MAEPTRSRGSVDDTVSTESSNPDLKFFRRTLSSNTIQEVTNIRVTCFATEPLHLAGTEPTRCGEVKEAESRKVEPKGNELERSTEEESFAGPVPAMNLTEEASNTSYEQEEGASYCPDTSRIRSKGKEFLVPHPKKRSKEKKNDEKIKNEEKDVRSAMESLNLMDTGERPYQTERADSVAQQFARDENNPEKAYKKSSKSTDGESSNRRLNPRTTDTSSEYESVIGLPNTPNVYVSGVYISRTPESEHISRKDSQMYQPTWGARQRCYTISKLEQAFEYYPARKGIAADASASAASSSSALADNGLNNNFSGLTGWVPPYHPDRNYFLRRTITPPRSQFRDTVKTTGPPGMINGTPSCPCQTGAAGVHSGLDEERTFNMHKSSTEGALSSILYLDEDYLSEDDFHEVLFLVRRGSKRDLAKRKKKREETKKEDPPRKGDHDDFTSAL